MEKLTEDQKQSIIERLEKKMKQSCFIPEFKSDTDKSYNQALSDAINIIKEM